MPRLHVALTLGPLALAACASPAAPASVPEYAGLQVDPLPASMEPADDVESLELPCTGTEWPNGVDDDCDGQIDEQGDETPGALELALSWSGPADVQLVTEPALPETPAQECAPPRACLLRARLEELPAGTSFVVYAERSGELAQSEPAENDAAPGRDGATVETEDEEPSLATTVSLSAGSRGEQLGTLNAQLLPGQRREIARITVP